MSAGGDFREVVPLAAYRFSGSWLVGATTFAMDRAVPQVELIYQPGGTYAEGTLTIELGAAPTIIPATRPGSRRRRMMAYVAPPPAIDLADTIVFDARRNDYFNWSHQINLFLTLALCVRERVGAPMTILLPAGMSATAVDLYHRFGFETVLSDGPVTARVCHWTLSDIEAVTSTLHTLIAPFMATHDNDPAVFPAFPDLPTKVFLPRRGGRAIANEGEIERLLAASGYVKLYAEDLSGAEQFALLRGATDLVAVHGAALAPLQFRSRQAPPLNFVEICPIGHMTRMFRMMGEQVGSRDCAERGQMKSGYVDQVYAPKGPFMSHSNDSFVVDPHSVRIALEIVRTGGIVEDYPDRWPLSH